MKILITGSKGLLGQALTKVLQNKFELFGLGRKNYPEKNYFICDITNESSVTELISCLVPNIVIHAAAISNVDWCEEHPQQAHKINALGTENIAQASRDVKAFMIYISTDYVFDGTKATAYTEEDSPNPINVYGKTKLEGERLLQSILEEYFIVRTSWLFGPGKENFVTEILRRRKTEKELKIISDKFGSPTYTLDLSQAIYDLILLLHTKKLPAGRTDKTGRIFHISNSNFCSRYEFAREILRLADGNNTGVVPISSDDLLRPAKRPLFSVLDNSNFRLIFKKQLKPWQEALRQYLEEFVCLKN